MKKIKTVGLGVVAALALTALLGAGSASAASFHTDGSEVSPSLLEGSNEWDHTIAVSQGVFSCDTANLEGPAVEESETLTATPSYACTSFGVNMPVNANGCTYQFGVDRELYEGTYEGTVDIVCPESEGITFTPFPACQVALSPQEDIGTVTYSNFGSGDSREIAVEAWLEGIAYTASGSMCSGSSNGGGYNGTWTVRAYDELGEQTGAWIG